jgi:hypothetical protein
MPAKPATLTAPALKPLEQCLQALATALGTADANALDSACNELLAELHALAIPQPTVHAQPDRLGGPERAQALRSEATVRSLRESLTRAIATHGRAMQALAPGQPLAYGSDGSGVRAGSSGSLIA